MSPGGHYTHTLTHSITVRGSRGAGGVTEPPHASGRHNMHSRTRIRAATGYRSPTRRIKTRIYTLTQIHAPHATPGGRREQGQKTKAHMPRCPSSRAGPGCGWVLTVSPMSMLQCPRLRPPASTHTLVRRGNNRDTPTAEAQPVGTARTASHAKSDTIPHSTQKQSPHRHTEPRTGDSDGEGRHRGTDQ